MCRCSRESGSTITTPIFKEMKTLVVQDALMPIPHHNLLHYTYILWNCCKKKNSRSWLAFHFNAQNNHKTTIDTAPFWYSKLLLLRVKLLMVQKSGSTPLGGIKPPLQGIKPPLGGIKSPLGGITCQPQLVSKISAIDCFKAPVFSMSETAIKSIVASVNLSYPGDTQSGKCMFGV